jgi:hypothetical protein
MALCPLARSNACRQTPRVNLSLTSVILLIAVRSLSVTDNTDVSWPQLYKVVYIARISPNIPIARKVKAIQRVSVFVQPVKSPADKRFF